MDVYTHTIIATSAIAVAYSLGRYVQNSTLHEKVVGWVLEKLEKNKKQYVLLTNAPRPNFTVIEYLKKIMDAFLFLGTPTTDNIECSQSSYI